MNEKDKIELADVIISLTKKFCGEKSQEEQMKIAVLNAITETVKNHGVLGDVIETPEEAFDRGYTAGMATGRKLMGKGSL